jgi:multimeric flavodoxin WrbA
VQTPGPEIWESIEFAGKKNAIITPGLARGGLQEDIIRYFAQCLASNGPQITPNHLSIALSA